MDLKPHVVLLSHTPDPEKLVAAARLCYSGANIGDLVECVSGKDVLRETL